MNTTLTAPNGMLALRLHASLAAGLFEAARIDPTVVLGPAHAATLDEWAATCENPAGQKADLARAVAGLIRVSVALDVASDTPARSGGFWERVAQ